MGDAVDKEDIPKVHVRRDARAERPQHKQRLEQLPAEARNLGLLACSIHSKQAI